jgi:hypothetical protein
MRKVDLIVCKLTVYFSVIVLLVVPVTLVRAQSATISKCTVATQQAFASEDLIAVRINSDNSLGSFEVLNRNGASRHVYRLPRANLYVIATVSLSDTFLNETGAPDLANLRLLISRTRREDIAATIAYAETEIAVAALFKHDSSVTTIVKGSAGRLTMVTLQCANT